MDQMAEQKKNRKRKLDPGIWILVNQGFSFAEAVDLWKGSQLAKAKLVPGWQPPKPVLIGETCGDGFVKAHGMPEGEWNISAYPDGGFLLSRPDMGFLLSRPGGPPGGYRLKRKNLAKGIQPVLPFA